MSETRKLYKVYLFGKPFGEFLATSPNNAIVYAKLSSPLFRTEPYSHFRAEVIEKETF